MEQTAVEWLVERYVTKSVITLEDIKQAKEMEKEQIIAACQHGNNFEQGDLNCEAYYNKTFGDNGESLKN